MSVVTERRLRELIASTMRDAMSRTKIEDVLVGDLGFFPPSNIFADLTKVQFVEAVLARATIAQLVDTALYLDEYLPGGAPNLLELVAELGPSGVAGQLKNLIFASDGPKPEIVLEDAVNNDIRITRHEQSCLVYDRPVGPGGLTWRELGDWWADRERLTHATEEQAWSALHQRLRASLADGPEHLIFGVYAQRYLTLGPDIPALLPQIYLHYDPYTRRQRQEAAPLARQRMDFLLLCPNRVRIVIECDGRQHYAGDDGRADPRRYSAMVSEDRQLRLRGYEVYRFGGAELSDCGGQQLVADFFDRLDRRYDLTG